MSSVVFADLVGSTGIFEKLGDQAASRFITQLTSNLGQVFERHHGRVVKVLGDGLFVVFASAQDALLACIAIQESFTNHPAPQSYGFAVQWQMGIESGEVVQIEGDCFGDVVNSAARLADLAGAAQVLATQAVWDALPPIQRWMLRSLGPIHLRGKADATHVYRVQWQTEQESEATVLGVSIMAKPSLHSLTLSIDGRTLKMEPGGQKVTIGRSNEASLPVSNPQVSRVHATVDWVSGHFVLTDTSSYGTWVYLGNQSQAIVLRRTECQLVGSGAIVLGSDRDEANVPLVQFSMA